VAFTYNDPVIFLEYAVDVAAACLERGIKTVAVTAGYICPEPRTEFFRHIDAANIDLKAFTEEFYYQLCGAHLQPVLDTLVYLKNETDVWFEVTTLLIPGENDSDAEVERLAAWFLDNLGSDVPLHFTAFHPDFKMRDKPRTPHETLLGAQRIARAAGLNTFMSATFMTRPAAVPIARDAASRSSVAIGMYYPMGASIAPVAAPSALLLLPVRSTARLELGARSANRCACARRLRPN